MKGTLYTTLLVAFIDFFGVGLVYPLFSSMLFDTSYPLLPPEATPTARGIWLGALITLMPLMQFFSAPLWGGLSDGRGRKKPLQLSLLIVLGGYFVAIAAVLAHSLIGLLLSRALIGLASGNTSIVQATIADLSSQEQKAHHFGLYAMALGVGFALGPFLGGLLSMYGYLLPFVVAAGIIALNLLFTLLFQQETHFPTTKTKIHPFSALIQLKKAFQSPYLRTILFVSFLFNFGWSYFFEFAPVYLIHRFHFSSFELGLFYGGAGGLYALSTGLLIRPFVARFSSEKLFFSGIFYTALAIFALPFLPSTLWLWPVIFCMCFFVSFVTPTSTSLISNSVGPEIQGEVLGNLNAVNSAAFVLSPLFSGSFVGAYPSSPLWLGGSVMILASLLLLRQRATRTNY